jgi:hypothetical protein
MDSGLSQDQRNGVDPAGWRAATFAIPHVDVEQLESWGMRHGVSKDDLISNRGGSP